MLNVTSAQPLSPEKVGLVLWSSRLLETLTLHWAEQEQVTRLVLLNG